MFCPRCGNPMYLGPMGRYVCPRCQGGDPLEPRRPGPGREPAPYPGVQECPKCGALIPFSTPTCPRCGYQFPKLL
ncbi:MAG: hypothetical protein ACTSU5_20545 [Promethearchaeota archaeon]